MKDFTHFGLVLSQKPNFTNSQRLKINLNDDWCFDTINESMSCNKLMFLPKSLFFVKVIIFSRLYYCKLCPHDKVFEVSLSSFVAPLCAARYWISTWNLGTHACISLLYEFRQILECVQIFRVHTRCETFHLVPDRIFNHFYLHLVAQVTWINFIPKYKSIRILWLIVCRKCFRFPQFNNVWTH